MKKGKGKTDFDRIIWSDGLLDKILSGFAGFILAGLFIFIIITFCNL
jgi:hypothetical protein